MREAIAQLIRRSASEEVANAYLAYHERKENGGDVARIAREILTNLPFKPGACAHLTAYWVFLARERLQLPVHGVIGHLAVNGTLVFGKPDEDLSAELRGATHDWDGHCWLVLGDLVGDISVCRTAYSAKSPPLLRETILPQFGPGCGALLATAEQWRETGLEYRPKRMMSDEEIEGLAHGTKAFYGYESPPTD